MGRPDELDMAEAAYHQAVLADPSSMASRIALGQVLLQKERYDSGVSEYRAAAALHKGTAWPLLMEGNLYAHLGDVESARATFEEAIAVDPGNVGGYIKLGNLSRQEKDHEAAMVQYRRAREVYPGAAWTLETIGHSYRGRQMLEEALDSFSQSLSLDPTRTGAYAAMANLYKGWSNPQDTAAHFDLLSRQQPDVPWYAGLAAHIYKTLDKVAEATEHYEKLLTFVPHYADAHYNLALLYERGSDGRTARRHWNTYLALAAGRQYTLEAEARREALRRVVITAPTDDEPVCGQAAIRGSALIDDFWYYKVEFRDPAHGEWQVIGELHYQPVSDGLLETWDTTGLPAGAYRLRLVVVNLTGQFVPPYELQVNVGP